MKEDLCASVGVGLRFHKRRDLAADPPSLQQVRLAAVMSSTHQDGAKGILITSGNLLLVDTSLVIK